MAVEAVITWPILLPTHPCLHPHPPSPALELGGLVIARRQGGCNCGTALSFCLVHDATYSCVLTVKCSSIRQRGKGGDPSPRPTYHPQSPDSWPRLSCSMVSTPAHGYGASMSSWSSFLAPKETFLHAADGNYCNFTGETQTPSL